MTLGFFRPVQGLPYRPDRVIGLRERMRPRRAPGCIMTHTELYSIALFAPLGLNLMVLRLPGDHRSLIRQALRPGKRSEVPAHRR